MKAKIKLACKQVIDNNSGSYFERAVFQASYQEFLLKSQAYNPEGKHDTFTLMKLSDGRANSLHYKLSFAVGHFIAALDSKIPRFTDNAGKAISFEVPQFELIESSITDKSLHKIAIHYITPELTLVMKLGDYLVLSAGNEDGGVVETFTVKMHDELSVISYREAAVQDGMTLYKAG